MRKARLLQLFAIGCLAVPFLCMIGIPRGLADEPLDGSLAAKASASPSESLTLPGKTLYGTTNSGGTGGKGTIFKFDTEKNAVTVLYSFAGPPNDGTCPAEPLTLVGTTLYGVTHEGGGSDKGTIFKFDIDKNVETVVYDFEGGKNDGSDPYGSLTLSGTTLYGMTTRAGAHGKGAIFKFDTKEEVPTVLYNFAGGENDGAYPYGSLTLSGTTLYGMTNEGGENNKGTIFKFDTVKNAVTLLYSFAGPPKDGAYPAEPFALVGTTLYAMTYQGGANGKGTIFKFDTEKNVETVVHNFIGGTKDGAYPYGSLTFSGTSLYAMTSQGGAGHAGTVFKFDIEKNVPTVLHSFAGGANDGAYPFGSLALSGTTLYGMTHGGGAGGAGTIFKFDTEKDVTTVLHSFTGGTKDGAYPFYEPLTSDNLPDYPKVGAMSAASSSISSRAVPCKGSVYTVDPDPKGTNVRSSPDKKSPVLIVLPSGTEGNVVNLSASFEDWLLIHSARGVDSGFWFRGQGWVHGSLLGVRAVPRGNKKVSLHSKPDAKSPVVKTFTEETEARLEGCKGDWLQVTIGKQKGWLAPDDYCGNPVTTCP